MLQELRRLFGLLVLVAKDSPVRLAGLFLVRDRLAVVALEAQNTSNQMMAQSLLHNLAKNQLDCFRVLETHILWLVGFVDAEGIFEESLGGVELRGPVKDQANVRVNGRHFRMAFAVDKFQEVASAVKKFQ